MKYQVSFELSFLSNPYKGKFIALEGIDGSGKSTQKKVIFNLLKKQNKKVILTQEPTREGHIGKLIHNILQSEISIPKVGLQYLFAADRSVHQEQIVIPALKEGNFVISERCFWSSVPYGLSDKENINYLDKKESLLAAYSLLSMYNQFVIPDKTFYLDIPVKIAVERLSKMSKNIEIYEKKTKLEKIYDGYQFLLNKFPKEFIIINGLQTEEDITKEILTYL